MNQDKEDHMQLKIGDLVVHLDHPLPYTKSPLLISGAIF